MRKIRFAIPAVALGLCHRVDKCGFRGSGASRGMLERVRTHDGQNRPSDDRCFRV
jgi:hypothetical protein